MNIHTIAPYVLMLFSVFFIIGGVNKLSRFVGIIGFTIGLIEAVAPFLGYN